MLGILLDADHPWANVLEQAVKDWWHDRSGARCDGNGQHAGHDPTVPGFAGVPPTLIDSQWPPYSFCNNIFADVGELGLNENAALRIRQSKILPPLLNSKPANPHTCWSCFQTFACPIRLQVCGGCKVARYCGAECQKKDWKKEHKRECQCMVVPKDLLHRIKRNPGPEKETYLDALVRLWNRFT